jgi:hypothetical protein
MSQASVSAIIAGSAALLGVIVGGWLDYIARGRERREERRDRRREERRTDLRELQEAAGDMYATAGSSLGPVPSTKPPEAADRVMAAMNRGNAAAARIGDQELVDSFGRYAQGMVELVLTGPSDELVERTGELNRAVHRRITYLFATLDDGS